jgi:hypothetical protein
MDDGRWEFKNGIANGGMKEKDGGGKECKCQGSWGNQVAAREGSWERGGSGILKKRGCMMKGEGYEAI